MNEKYLLPNQIAQWVGFNAENGGRNSIIDTYNSITPLPRGYALKYTDAWCAATISAAVHLCGLADKIPQECSCQKMIEKAQKMGIWVEDDAYSPSVGDLILYDWQDDGNGDCTGWADHIGCVESNTEGTLTVLEGNININGTRCVGRREITVNAQYIRGYITPIYKGVTGSLDCATETCIGGWAYDGTDDACNVEIQICLVNGEILGTIQTEADEYRADLAPAGIGNGFHAFTYAYSIYDWAMTSGKYVIRVIADGEYIGSKQLEITLPTKVEIWDEDINKLKELIENAMQEYTKASEYLGKATETILKGVQDILAIKAHVDTINK